ncbi:MAG: oxidoreductase, partial [Bacteroidetes bacterium]|nr:oxidoreductase [Bacteroidota bacterium]
NIASFTIDGGKSWQTCETMPKEYRSCVQYVTNGNKKLFFAIGKTGCDYSVDGGKNWKFMNNKGYYTFRVVPGKLQGFVSGGDGKIARVVLKQD